MMISMLRATAVAIAAGLCCAPAIAGPVLLTGHDPDFHAQGQLSGQQQLGIILNFVTGGTYSLAGHKFLFVESNLAATSGHRVGKDGLTGTAGVSGIGLTEGVNFDQVDAAGLAALPNFSGYSAIVVASSFGGMLTGAEINALIARKSEIASFVNAGGGLAAFAECTPSSGVCDASNVAAGTDLFGFVPVTVSSVTTVAPYIVTPFGAGMGFTNAMVDDCCTHNSFGAIGGLSVVDFDQVGTPTTLAGNVTIDTTGFHPTPEPVSLALLCVAGLGLFASRRKA